MSLLAPAELNRVRRLALVARQAGRDALAACGRRGRLGEAERAVPRDYSPGDDYLAVDWNLCARLDELRVRPLAMRPQPRLNVLVDCSRSMAIGRPSKFDAARRLAAVLAAMLADEGAATSVATFADRLVGQWPPVFGASELPGLLRFLDGASADGGPADFSRAVDAWTRRAGAGGPVLVATDLHAWDDFQRGLIRLAEAGGSPWVIHVIDRGEAEPNLRGDVAIVDVETGQAFEAVLTKRRLDRYRRLFAQFCESAAAGCRRRGWPYFRLEAQAWDDDAFWRRLGGALWRRLGGVPLHEGRR